MTRTYCWLMLLLACIPEGYGQGKYWIYFKDKEAPPAGQRCVSERTVANRLALGLAPDQYTDWPVKAAYAQRLAAAGLPVVSRSRWLNAVTVRADPGQLEALRRLDFVARVRPVASHGRPAAVPRGNGRLAPETALGQINAPALRKHNLSARGVMVGIIDGRFMDADRRPQLQHIFRDGRVLGHRSFLEPGTARFFGGDRSPMGSHGTEVWQCVGGWDARRKQPLGLATGASFYLASTDDSATEFRGEEDYWIAAVEWMDSLGVRLVNSSLVYSLNFDLASENHTAAEMDGNTTPIAKAAQVATAEKGMIVVVAAGNDGANPDWQVVATPADAPGVLAVGATDQERLKMDFSAIGSGTVPFLKPDVACLSLAGTSLAAPIVTGLIACLLEKNPALKGAEAADIVRKAGHLYPYGNNFLGYGVPDAGRAVQLLQNPASAAPPAETVRTAAREVTLGSKAYRAGSAQVFHKKDQWYVLAQEVQTPEAGKFIIAPPAGATRTTVVLDEKVVEIFWE